MSPENEAYDATRVSKGASGGKGLKVLEDAIRNRFSGSDDDEEDSDTSN